MEEARERGPVYWLVLNAEANVEVDLTAMDALSDLRQRLEQEGVRLVLARVKDDLWHELDRAGVVDEVGADYVFPTLPTAVGAYAEWYERTQGRKLPHFDTPPSGPLRPEHPPEDPPRSIARAGPPG